MRQQTQFSSSVYNKYRRCHWPRTIDVGTDTPGKYNKENALLEVEFQAEVRHGEKRQFAAVLIDTERVAKKRRKDTGERFLQNLVILLDMRRDNLWEYSRVDRVASHARISFEHNEERFRQIIEKMNGFCVDNPIRV